MKRGSFDLQTVGMWILLLIVAAVIIGAVIYKIKNPAAGIFDPITNGLGAFGGPD